MSKNRYERKRKFIAFVAIFLAVLMLSSVLIPIIMLLLNY